MRIGIEAQRALRPDRHGMDVVALETIRALLRQPTAHTWVVFVDRPDTEGLLGAAPNLEVVVVRAPSYPLWEQIALPLAARRARVDLLHCTANTAPLRAGVPIVLTLHDVIFLTADAEIAGRRSLYQELGWWYRRAVVPRVAPRAAAVGTVSAYERGRVAAALGLPVAGIDVVYNGVGAAFRVAPDPVAAAALRARLGLRRPYLLFLGNTDPKKNSERVVRAWARARARLPDGPDLVVADLPQRRLDAWLDAEGARTLRPALHTPGYVPQHELVHLYDGAVGVLYPSLAESFGLPMVEAMARGRAVVTADATALPEIAGGAADLVDPTDLDALTDAIVRLCADPAHRAALEARGPARAAAFDWDRSARTWLSVYDRLTTKLHREAA